MTLGKPSIKNFSEPRPKFLKVIGEWLSAISKTSAIGAFTTDDKTLKTIAICLFAAGWLGELFTKLYSAYDTIPAEEDIKSE